VDFSLQLAPDWI